MTAEPALILHHYSLSPYAQKIRAMLGYSQLSWQSVITSEAPPRPKLAPLTGGYRKIPVAQIGADVFCDTRSIAREIAALAKRPKLSPDSVSEAGQHWIDAAEGRMFLACVMQSVGPKFLFDALREVPFRAAVNLVKDRQQMGKTAALKAPGRKEAQAMVRDHLANLEQQLSGDFLLGDEPELADFAVYHSLWMVHVKGARRFIRRYPKTVAWIERIEAFGIGAPQPIDAEQALETARHCEPRDIVDSDKQHEAIGREVSIGPNDYAQDTTRGLLVGGTDNSWIVARQHALTGTVHVHFPKRGYEMVLA